MESVRQKFNLIHAFMNDPVIYDEEDQIKMKVLDWSRHYTAIF